MPKKLEFGNKEHIKAVNDFESPIKETLLPNIIQHCRYCENERPERKRCPLIRFTDSELYSPEEKISIFRLLKKDNLIIWRCDCGGRYLITDITGELFSSPNRDGCVV